MAWITGNRYLSEAEMQNNTRIISAYLATKGWTVSAISGLLGNMESESTINPGIWQSLIENNMSGGYGLVQWTPATNFTNWADENGYKWDDGNAQLKWIDERTTPTGQWIATSTYNFSFEDFKISLQSPEYLASAFLKNFERAGVEVEEERRTQARKWYNFLIGIGAAFSPRLTDDGMLGSFYWYSDNPFYQSGYGLPNCTCYAWGRFWEISDTSGNGSNRPTLPTGNAGTWYPNVTGYEKGDYPKLGAVICWFNNSGGAGHVAIVEEISKNGDITTSNSAWEGTYFYTQRLSASSGYNLSGYTLQGFIYNPFVESFTPITPVRIKRNKFNFILFNRNRRWRA